MPLPIDPTTQALGLALGGLAQRESATATNIANVDTPGYRPVAVSFEQALQQQMTGSALGGLAMRTTDARHLGGAAGGTSVGIETTNTSPTRTLRNDGNGVDVETEMTTLTETQIRYSGVSKLLAGKLGMFRDVMTKGA